MAPPFSQPYDRKASGNDDVVSKLDQINRTLLAIEQAAKGNGIQINVVR